jgi:thiol-disulfide isomerase/thioredoxin
MIEELPQKKALKKESALLIMLSIIGLASLIIGLGASYYMQSNQAKQQANDQIILQEFLKGPWNDQNAKEIDTTKWQGKTLVINFWGSWCPPCVEEMPALSNLQDEFSSKNVLFVGIGIDTPSNIRQFLETTLVSYPIVMGGLQGSKIGKALGNTQGALPYTVVINAKGKVTNTKLGKISEDELRKQIKAAI